MSAAPPPLAIVAAVARNGVIGGDNRLLWKLRGDMHHFRAMTMGRPLVMGRKTWDSIGRPLPGRETIVVTRDPGFSPPGAFVAHDLEGALAMAAASAERLKAPEIMVVGGGELYAQLIDRCAALHITEVDLEPPGDAYFPAIDPRIWREASRVSHPAGPGDEASYSFVDYIRA